MRSFFWPVFSYIRTDYRKIRTKKTPYLDTFHVVEGFEKHPLEEIIISNFFYLRCEFIWSYFDMLRNLGRIFFAVALVGCFLRILNKQGHLLKKNEVSQDVFHPGTKYLYGKYCFSYSRILLDRDG